MNAHETPSPSPPRTESLSESSRMTPKRAFLLTTARRIVGPDISAYYDEGKQLNISYDCGKPNPLVLKARTVWTSSKTESAPGDDDPDPEVEKCY